MGDSEELVSSSSSDSSASLAKPLYDGSKFANPPSFKNWGGIPSPWSIIKWKTTETDRENVPKDSKVLDETVPVKPLDNFTQPAASSGELYASWLGHATMLVHLEGINLITDPIWAERASFLSFMGPKRYRPPPMKIEDLPKIDIGVISHDHYDHLDEASVKKITDRHELLTRIGREIAPEYLVKSTPSELTEPNVILDNPNIRWFVPLQMGAWLKTVGIENTEENPDKVTEMTWGQATEFVVNGKTYTVRSIPAQHWGQRGAFDRNQRLWSGWIVSGEKKRFLYTGDTGFCDDEYKKIGAQFGPFDLAAIPIGAYEPRWFMKSQHINPEEAVSIHEYVKSKFSIGIHWGTYHMGSYEYYLEPKEKLEEIMRNRTELPSFITINMGEIWKEEK